MSNVPAQTAGYPCPFCQAKTLETTATAPYVRGFLLAYQIGRKSLIGCTDCVRKRLRREAGLSALIGWFSITALIINPFLIIYNLIQSFFVSKDDFKVKKKLKEMGLPLNPQTVSILDISYALAACMVLADGKVEEEELRIAEEIGEKLFKDFDEAKFRLLFQTKEQLPDVHELAIMLKNQLDTEGKISIFKYLLAIAKADGTVSSEEQQMLQKVAQNMELDLKAVEM